MVFEIGWLEGARRELDAEIEYVYSEFGEDSARRARTKIKEAVDPLDTFPNYGCGVMASCIAATRCA